MIHILIVEDDADINQILAKIMRKQGYEPIQAFSGSEAKLLLFSNQAGGSTEKLNGDYDLILLDLMLPGVMGEDLVGSIREKSDVPIIVISAKSALEDRVRILNLGADDYLVKPFEKEEVIARVNGALRRYKGGFHRNGVDSTNQTEGKKDFPMLAYRNLEIYPQAREAKIFRQDIPLTAHEFDILYLLVQNPGKVYSRESLYEQIWEGGYYGEDNTVNVHVSNLRKKIAAFDKEEYIKTVWGIGFKMA